MDPFEPIRRAALKLHAKALARNADPNSPNSLVAHALEIVGLTAQPLPPDSPTLRGAKALLDWQTDVICYANDIDEGTRVLVIAHEIGHRCLHEGNCVCRSDDIDPSQPAEPTRVGLQRVEDYGVRERRELQANVFAREFLFPRELAGRRFLEDRVGASFIASQSSLDRNLVRQQILDAILLPPPPEEASNEVPTRRTSQNDPSQDEAIRHRGVPFQLQAGPGTGKTGTLVRRAIALVGEGVDPSQILVLTFSNRAAAELADRIGAALPKVAPQIWIGTFHSFGLDLLRRYHDRLNLTSNPPLFDRSDAVEVLEEILPTLRLQRYRDLFDPTLILREFLQAISRAKDELADPLRYQELGRAMLDEAGEDEDLRKVAEKCLEVGRVYELYQGELEKRQAVDFGDLVMKPAVLLRDDAAIRSEVRLRHQHVLVDEYQDVNRASGELLRQIAGESPNVWVVGDSRQSIYRFRGASSSNMASFTTDFPGAVVRPLSINYRSSKEIVDTFVGIAPHMSASAHMLPLELTAHRGSNGELPQLRSFEYASDESEGVAASIRELEAVGVALRDQAVLCRSNARLNELAAVLQARGIPALHLGSLFERDEVRDLLALLSLAVDTTGSGLVRVGNLSRYRLGLQDTYLLLKAINNEPSDEVILRRLSPLSSLPGLSDPGKRTLSLIAEDLTGLDRATSAWEFLTAYLLDRSPLLEEMARGQTIIDRIKCVALWQFLNFIREQPVVKRGHPIRKVLDRVRRLTLLADERDLRQVPAAAAHINAVRLMTVHASKGLEFDAVHIPGLTVASFPTTNKGQQCPPPVGLIVGSSQATGKEITKRDHEQEEQCLFFVAVSRARNQLRLYNSRRMPNGNNRNRSPYLDWIATSLLQQSTKPAQIALPSDAPVQRDLEISFPEPWAIGYRRLKAYYKCPLRFFYTHVLDIRGARTLTPFSNTHNCLHEVIRWLTDKRLSAHPTEAELLVEVNRIWSEKGPVDHAYAEDYKRILDDLSRTLFKAGLGVAFLKPVALKISFPKGIVLVEPTEMATLADDKRMFRIVNTGRKRSDEYDRPEYALHFLGARTDHGENFQIRALHLTDGVEEAVAITARRIQSSSEDAEKALEAVLAGKFPATPDAVSCPRCPHFFICAAVPAGSLDISEK